MPQNRMNHLIVVEEVDTEFGLIKILRSKYDGTYSYFQDTCFHGEIDNEGVSTCGYIHVMCSAILQTSARKILMIGCAAGTLATMLHKEGCELTVVDINAVSFDLAKSYFEMPDEIECVVEEGSKYLHETNMKFDAIAIDAFTSEAQVPGQFTTNAFFQDAQRVLNPNGILVMNVIVKNDLDPLADQIAACTKSAALRTIIFERSGKVHRNAVLACGNIDHIQIDYLDQPTEIWPQLYGIAARLPRKLASGEVTVLTS